MLDHQPELHGNHLSPLSPTLKMHVRRSSTGDRELDIWGSRNSACYESFGDQFSFSTEQVFQGEGLGEQGFGVFSPRLWKSNRSRSIKDESYPLLPHNHHYSNLSPNSRRRVIVDGRKELMKMIENMPESSYELSLKDIVDEQRSSEEDEEETSVAKDESSDFKGETHQIRKLKQRKNRNTERGPITRTGSMESEMFLIKMFFPTSLGTKKKTKAGNPSRVPCLKSPKQSENDMEKDWSIKGFFVAGGSKSICRSSTSGSSSSSDSSSSRYFHLNLYVKLKR